MVRNDVIELSNGKKLMIETVDANRLMIDASQVAFVDIIKNKQSNIESILFEGKESVSLGDEIETRVGAVKTVYKVNDIMISKDKKFIALFEDHRNKTSLMLLPLLNKSQNNLKFNSYFTNAFIDENKQYIGIVYRFTGSEQYKDFEESLLKDKLCVKHIEYDRYHVMYLFRIPDEFIDDVELFFEGKYSKFSKKLKDQVIKFHNITKNGTIYQILYRSEELRKLIEEDLGVTLLEDAELSSIPVKEEEMFKMK